jgi:multiple sugar transport system ATP-binding protein
MPALAQDAPGREFILGARPEHISLTPDSPLRAEIFGTEYLGTTQIVTLQLRGGTSIKARVASDVQALVGDHVGLALDSSRLSVFAGSSGSALRTTLHEPGAVHG